MEMTCLISNPSLGFMNIPDQIYSSYLFFVFLSSSGNRKTWKWRMEEVKLTKNIQTTWTHHNLILRGFIYGSSNLVTQMIDGLLWSIQICQAEDSSNHLVEIAPKEVVIAPQGKTFSENHRKIAKIFLKGSQENQICIITKIHKNQRQCSIMFLQIAINQPSTLPKVSRQIVCV